MWGRNHAVDGGLDLGEEGGDELDVEHDVEGSRGRRGEREIAEGHVQTRVVGHGAELLCREGWAGGHRAVGVGGCHWVGVREAFGHHRDEDVEVVQKAQVDAEKQHGHDAALWIGGIVIRVIVCHG